MKEKEMKLLRMIREQSDPEHALVTAAKIILGFLKQHESSEALDSVYPQEHD